MLAVVAALWLAVPALKVEAQGQALQESVRQSSCSPRPPLTLQVALAGEGRVLATIRAGAGLLREIRVGRATNALIDVPGQPPGATGELTIRPPAGSTESAFVVRQIDPTAAVTVPLVAVDGCGDWPTFVGAGAGSWRATLAGVVRNGRDGQPIGGARVLVEGVGETSTDFGGGFAFERVPVGSYTLRTEASGFQPDSRGVTIAGGSRAFVQIDLSPVTSLAVPGVVLSGDPSAPATGATTNLPPAPAPPSEIDENGVILSRLDVVLAPGASVGQVNSALDSVGARIVSMRAGSPFVTVAIPRAADATALATTARVLSGAPGIAIAFPSDGPEPKTLPPAPEANRDEMSHLLAMRFPAAWNAKRLATTGCESRRLPVLVVDTFIGTLPASHNRFEAEVPSFRFVSPLALSTGSSTHGYDVTTTLAAHFDARHPTGAQPFTQCLDILGVPVVGTTYLQEIQTVANSFPAGKFIMNYSQGYTDKCAGVCQPAEFATYNSRVPPPLNRALHAVSWKAATRDRWDDFLVAVAAGNERNKQAGQIYPGAGTSAFDSYISVATEPSPLFGRIQDATLWGANGGFPSLAATPAGMTTLQATINAAGVAGVGSAPNVLMVGSTTNDAEVANLAESAFSDSAPDVKAIGELVFTLGGARNGTSYSTPQVAGLAAYLWLLSPELRSEPAEVTRAAIVANVRANVSTTGIVDAYATVLSLDQAVLPTPGTAPVRLAILDVNDDGIFSVADIDQMLRHQLNTQGQPVTPTTPVATPSTRDYSRYDLNGDGFTGGFTLAAFDLDRVGSTRFGAPRLTADVTQDIQGLELRFDETTLTDLAILCYYAYSGLFQGTADDRALRGELLGLTRCGRLELEAAFTGSVEPNTDTPLTIRAVRRSPVTDQLVPTTDVHLSLLPSGGTVQDASGITGANGTFQTTARVGSGGQLGLLIEARSAPGGSVLATITAQSQAPPSGLAVLAATAKAGANPATFPNDSCRPDTTPPPMTVLSGNVTLPVTLSAMCRLIGVDDFISAQISGRLLASGNSFMVRDVTVSTDGNTPFAELDILVQTSGASRATVTLAGEPTFRSSNRFNAGSSVSISVAPSGTGGSGGVFCQAQSPGTGQTTPPPWICQEEPIHLVPNAAIRIQVGAIAGGWDLTFPDITVTVSPS